MKQKFLVIHCTATPKGREVSSDEIRQWHLGPKILADGKVIYKGKTYDAISALPPEYIGGAKVYRLTGRGWSQVGYSDLIHLNGSVENLVPHNDDDNIDPWEITNGVAGINAMTRHVVYAGGLSKDGKTAEDTRTPEQHTALLAYVQQAIAKNPALQIAGHNQFDLKDCPSFSVVQWAMGVKLPKKNIYPAETKKAKTL